MPGKTEMVLRIPIHGFAKRADDTAARAMAVLRAKDNSNPKKSSSMPEHPTKGKVARDGSHRSSLNDSCRSRASSDHPIEVTTKLRLRGG